MPTYLGTTDEVTACDCCGRSDLKSTVAIETDSGEVVYYGVVCAARALKSTAKDVKAATKAADDARTAEEREARETWRRAEGAAWKAHVFGTLGFELGSSAWFDGITSKRITFGAVREGFTFPAFVSPVAPLRRAA